MFHPLYSVDLMEAHGERLSIQILVEAIVLHITLM